MFIKMAKRDKVVEEKEVPTTKEEINQSLVSSKVYVATQEDLFSQALREVEDAIVLMFTHGASLSAITRRYPTYTPHRVAEIIEKRLSVAALPVGLYPAMTAYGFQDDLFQLTLLLEDKSSEVKDKLKAVELRTKTRESLVRYLQSQDILLKPVSEGGVHDNPLFGDQKPSSIVINFESLQTPEERQRYIECLKNGQVYEPVES